MLQKVAMLILCKLYQPTLKHRACIQIHAKCIITDFEAKIHQFLNLDPPPHPFILCLTKVSTIT